MGIFFFFFFGCYYVYCFGSEAGVYTKLQWNLSTKTTIERVGERERERETNPNKWIKFRIYRLKQYYGVLPWGRICSLIFLFVKLLVVPVSQLIV